MAALDLEVHRPRMGRPARRAWLMPLVAVLIAIAIVASLIAGYNVLHHTLSDVSVALGLTWVGSRLASIER